ncbi:MAG: recombination-associated protein RdgC [Thermodesulfobacteriota bacterium]|nr:recombination-associated protein RdgC [Thermodesulfobacteriota bacterium]
MGFLSSSVSVTRYKVEGKVREPFFDTIADGLKRDAIKDSDDGISVKRIGWTSFDRPFAPDFDGSSFVIGSNLVFSLRIDKKVIPQKIIKKYYSIEVSRQLTKSGRQYLMRDEKKLIKDKVMDTLILRIPATPFIYDVIWDIDRSLLWFFSNLKSANEELETLFSQSFNLSLIRLFPFTIGDLIIGLSNKDRDILSKLTSTKFTA